MKNKTLIGRLNCAFGNHTYDYAKTVVTRINDDICRVEQECKYCGKPFCYLCRYSTLEMNKMTEGEEENGECENCGDKEDSVADGEE